MIEMGSEWWVFWLFWTAISGGLLAAIVAALHRTGWNAILHPGWPDYIIAYGLAALVYIVVIYRLIYRRRPFLDLGPDYVVVSEAGSTLHYSSITALNAYRAWHKTGDRIIGHRGTSVILAVGPWVPDPTGVVYRISVDTKDGCLWVKQSYVLDPPTILEFLAQRIASARGAVSWADIIQYHTERP
jgi:hypothetical protein